MQHSVSGLPKFSRKHIQCEVCGDVKTSQFPPSSRNVTEKLQLVHSAIHGPMPICSLNKKVFYITFIDDLTKKVWIAYLEKKSEAFKMFRAFRTIAEKESGNKVHTLVSDNCSEYTTTEFESYLTANNIQHQLTVPGENKAAEYINQAITQMTRTMLLFKNLPGYLWAEAVSTSMHIINTSSYPDGHSPDEKWYGRSPSVSHFRIFGSTCYVHILPQHRNELRAKSLQGIFIGYPIDRKGYKVFLPKQRKIIVTRDVIFAETQNTLLTLEARRKKMKPRFKDATLYDVQIPKFGGEDTAKLIEILESVNHSSLNTEDNCDDDNHSVPSHSHLEKGKSIVAEEAEDPVIFQGLRPSSSHSSDSSIFCQTFCLHEAPPQNSEGCSRDHSQLELNTKSDEVGDGDRAKTQQSQPGPELHLALQNQPLSYLEALKKPARIHVKQKACNSHSTWEQLKPPWK